MMDAGPANSQPREGLISTDDIAARAYEIYEREGRSDGRAMDHWLQAEAELRAENQRGMGQSAAAQERPRSARLQSERSGV